ncbi:MAG: Glycosyltransferase [uncultured Chloroflexi bacterium]|uniref:Glycosyltransferase n=1 Tax=uncultured Chloroflexota bacterium TaxID=166587 RepID=A0A6J4JHJ6_9CHLR|nr:MAG: Glycosyltransferase [uncultured Chloroflexota bacterium]
MKIGFHCWEFPPTIVGGLGTYAQCMTEALAALEQELVVWAPDQEWAHSVAPVQSPRITVRRIPLFDATPMFPHVIAPDMQAWGRFFSDILTFNLLAAAETRQAAGLDLVAIQDWLSGITGMVLAKERRVPLVFHVHSAEWGRQPGGGSPLVSHLEGALQHEADAVITVSDAMREDLIAHGWSADKVHAVWNGVDPVRYRPDAVTPERAAVVRREYGIAADEPLVLFVGRMTQVKGVHALVEAMPQVIAKNPRVRLVIVGKGELEEPVRERVRQLGIEEHVRLRYEFVNEEERIAHYAACDVTVFPSTYEPFGIVTLESMAMGKATVAGAKDVVGFREQVVAQGPSQSGVHVDGASPHDIAWGLNEALEDRDRLQQWGANGRQRVLDAFTWAHSAQKTLAVYRQTVERFRGGAATAAGAIR